MNTSLGRRVAARRPGKRKQYHHASKPVPALNTTNTGNLRTGSEPVVIEARQAWFGWPYL